jgi:hypothetical protein
LTSIKADASFIQIEPASPGFDLSFCADSAHAADKSAAHVPRLSCIFPVIHAPGKNGFAYANLFKSLFSPLTKGGKA